MGGPKKKLFTLLNLCVSSLRRGHANPLCIVPILTDDPRRESKRMNKEKKTWCCAGACSGSQHIHAQLFCGCRGAAIIVAENPTVLGSIPTATPAYHRSNAVHSGDCSFVFFLHQYLVYYFSGCYGKKLCTLLDLCVPSLRRGHANLLCAVPSLTDVPRRESLPLWPGSA